MPFNPYTYGTNMVGIGPLGMPAYTYQAYKMAENMAAAKQAEDWWNERWQPKKKKRPGGTSMTIEGEGSYGMDLPGGGRVDVDVKREEEPPPPPQRKLTLEERRKRGADSWGYLTPPEKGTLLLPDEVAGPITRENNPYEYKALGDAAFSMFTGPAPHKGGRLRKLAPGQVRVPDLGQDPLAHLEARNLARDAAKLAGVSPADIPMFRPIMEPGGKWVTYGTGDDLLDRSAGKKQTGGVARNARKRVDYMDYLKKKNRKRRGRSRRYR